MVQFYLIFRHSLATCQALNNEHSYKYETTRFFPPYYFSISFDYFVHAKLKTKADGITAARIRIVTNLCYTEKNLF